ncbi:MAG: orotidine-5'-phosphate decarboxylase [Rhodomicrobium sp.]
MSFMYERNSFVKIEKESTIWRSKKSIPTRERLIFALDNISSLDEAKQLISTLGDSVEFYKLGLELFVGGHYFYLLEYLQSKQKKSFVDLKFFDVPETVGNAVRQLKGRNANFVTVHGNDNILEAACKHKSGTKILAVTVLTSLNDADIKDLGFHDVNVEELVLSRARRAIEIGCDGVISSGLEAPRLRDNLGDNFLIVCPGIRPVKNENIDDDQKRTVDVETAFNNGADYIVVGRPIRLAKEPRQAAEDIQRRIAKIFGN